MNVLRQLKAGGNSYSYYAIAAAEAAGLAGVSRLPCSLKVVLENLLRHGESDDLSAISEWLKNRKAEREISFRFTRVLMPDSSGIPLLGDLAAMRDAMVRLGGDPKRLNTSVPVDLIVDHAVMVDNYGAPDAVKKNLDIELKRNSERYSFLRWGAQQVRALPDCEGLRGRPVR